MNITTTLDRLKPKEKGIVINIEGEKSIKRRLIDMGITPGVYIIFKKTSPFGDPIQISLRGYDLSIRKVEARQITIQKE